MQIGSTGTHHATSRLAAAQASRASSKAGSSDATLGGAATTGLTGTAGGLLSYMTGQSLAPADTGTAALVSDESLRSWARELDGRDRDMVESITGCTVAEDGSFVDADGKAASLSACQAAIVAALSLMRSEQSPTDAAQPITSEQYDSLCDRAQVALFQAGSQFDPNVRLAGHDYLNGTATQASASGDAPDLPAAVRHHVEDMVNDPAYAMDAVEQYATRPLGMMVKLPVPTDGREGWVDPEEVQASLDRWKACYETVNSAHSRARTLYEQGKAAGKSGAEIYADILRDEVAQPDSYWQARDPDNLSGNLKDQTQAELNALEVAIAAKRKA